jgi:exopolysaccharide biosynthesis polyprenyl glycosylphosphotransferase
MGQTANIAPSRAGSHALKPASHPPEHHVPGPDALFDPASSVAEGDSDRVVLRRDMLFRRALGLSDVLAATAALFIATAAVGSDQVRLLPALLLIPIVLIVNKAIGLYDRDEHLLRKTTLDEAPAIMHVAVLFALGFWLAQDVFLNGSLGRDQVLSLALGCFVLIGLGRVIARAAVLTVTPVERCIVLGGSAAAARISEKLQSAPSVKAVAVGRVGLHVDDNHGAAEPLPYLGDVNGLWRILAEQDVERVIIAPDDSDADQMLRSIRLVKALGVKVSVLPRLLEVVGSSSTFDDIDGITLLGVRRYGMTKSSERLKRCLDFVGAALGLLALAPLITMLAIAIKLDSRGPVFFRQPRIGRKGKTFQIVKFRSMVTNAEALKRQLHDRNETHGLFKIEDDPRITRVGRYIRRRSLDELPQLINVLKGDMSLVGPRPLVPDEDAKIEGWQRRRLVLRPGMTGLWQIFGSSRIPMHEMVKIDYMYGANWSIWLDAKILFRTVPYVISRRGM